MMNFLSSEHLSVQFKVYLLILHTVVLGLIVHIVVTVCYYMRGEDSGLTTKHSSGVRIVHVNDKRVTVESCQWINSILNWIYTNSSNTPDFIKIWLAMLNEKLKTEKSSLRCKINGIVPGSLPPNFSNVYCSDVNGTVQCIALHIEITRLGFFISLSDNNNPSGKSSDVEVSVTKLSGQLMFQILTRQSHYDLTVKFIGDPELQVSSQDISEDSERAAVEEKLKEVICKTVINIPLTNDKPGDENTVSSLIPEASSSCVDLEGKLLIKVVKASGLTGKEEADTPDAYCVITCREPQQKKKTTTIKASRDPLWNESHVLDISKKTKEIAFDVYNELKTLKGKELHMNDFSEKANDTESDFLGQVIVPLAMINKDQACRLILPILPMSSNSSYVTGQISLEFTYDKDGKDFKTSTQSQSTSSNTTKATKVVGRTRTDIEEATDESPQKLVFSMATIDIVEDEDDELHFEPLADHGINREDIVLAEQRVSEGLLANAEGTRSEHYEISAEDNEKHEEMLQELIELDRRSKPVDHSQQAETPKQTERNESKDTGHNKTEDRPSSRRSYQRDEPVSPGQSTFVPPPQKPHSPIESSDDKVEGACPLKLNEEAMQDLSPDTRRKIFRQAFNMRINQNNQPPPTEEVENRNKEVPSRQVESRYSYSSGDKPPSKTKSSSDQSLSSLYEGTKSVLVIETMDRGEFKYYQIPPLMAKRGTFDHKGTKLHICNDHLFVATHFTGSLPSCNICESPLTGYFGKQGYECRDCHLVTHKRCHLETNTVCPKSTLSSLKIKKAASIVGYK